MKFKVLIPVDTARNSLSAEEYAIKLNWQLPLSVTLLHVLNSKRLEGHGISPSDQDRILAAMRKTGDKVMAQAVEPFEKNEIEHITRFEKGAPGPLICQIAEDEGFDMVLIPQSGLSELEEILGGSVVRYVLTNCKLPVLLVKHSPDQADAQRKIRAEKELLPS